MDDIFSIFKEEGDDLNAVRNEKKDKEGKRMKKRSEFVFYKNTYNFNKRRT